MLMKLNFIYFSAFYPSKDDVCHCICSAYVSMKKRCETLGFPVQMKHGRITLLHFECSPNVSENDSRGYHLERRNIQGAIKKLISRSAMHEFSLHM